MFYQVIFFCNEQPESFSYYYYCLKFIWPCCIIIYGIYIMPSIKNITSMNALSTYILCSWVLFQSFNNIMENDKKSYESNNRNPLDSFIPFKGWCFHFITLLPRHVRGSFSLLCAWIAWWKIHVRQFICLQIPENHSDMFGHSTVKGWHGER